MQTLLTDKPENLDMWYREILYLILKIHIFFIYCNFQLQKECVFLYTEFSLIKPPGALHFMGWGVLKGVENAS